MSTVEIKSPKEIDTLRRACRLAAETLLEVGPLIRPGITTDDINRFARRHAAPRCTPGAAQLPRLSRACVDQRGVPRHPRSQHWDSDIINIDITHIYEGFHGDVGHVLRCRPSRKRCA
jgi:methionyl aminopeptidase